MTYKNTFISLSMMVIIVLTAWTTLSFRSSDNPSVPSTLLPDDYMEDVIAVIMDKQGKPSLIIKTPKMIHFVENDISELTTPQLTIYRQSPQPWYITSKYAKTRDGIDHVDFWQDVIIHHAADLISPATIIKTTKLTVHPNDRKAETDDHITLMQPSIIIKAKGMTADINDGSINLLSEARGEYVPS